MSKPNLIWVYNELTGNYFSMENCSISSAQAPNCVFYCLEDDLLERVGRSTGRLVEEIRGTHIEVEHYWVDVGVQCDHCGSKVGTRKESHVSHTLHGVAGDWEGSIGELLEREYV